MSAIEMPAADAARARGANTIPEGQPASGQTATHLALMIGEQRCLVDLPEAGEIVPMPGSMLQVPMTRDWFLGVVNVQGTLFTVVDLSRFMRGKFTPITKESRLVTMSPSLSFNATLVVTKMLGLRNSATMTLVSEQGPAEKPWLAQRFRDAEGHVWVRLSLSKLVSASAFLVVGR